MYSLRRYSLIRYVLHVHDAIRSTIARLNDVRFCTAYSAKADRYSSLG